MTRLHIPSTEQTPAASLPLLEAVNKQLGVVPNLMKVVGNSPAALEGYLSLNGALGKSKIGARTGERIALAIAEFNRCDYCLSAHTYLAANVAQLSAAEIEANRHGQSGDEKANAAVRFAVNVAQHRGHVSDEAVAAVKAAGFGDAEIIEIVSYVALNTLTNYVNSVVQTTIDFPLVTAYTA
ncbi:carboxymuconolactone decarboxylase family protein [Chitinibacter bivalviorum]|uniref:Carboxymuconolactone decarboxylase family protein n=1 Tax=Chitinibacter bivalviorum TaxID=2739434 RepID=A0A7H9BKP4_9NEIS|nr:carboxymuconolactone decarboxylase family protein [Chitinibacter bivalviorum]QLG89143.1 carboxymuconolactone decarboxylase family protein [Chitinibacter bivalviorum]